MTSAEDPTKHLYVPRYIKRDDIETITPFIGLTGRTFKTVTSIETYTNKNYIVVGNYEDHVNYIKKANKIGYSNY